MSEDNWPWPKWADAPEWATCVTQDADGTIRWWMYTPIAWSRAKRWLYEPPNKTEVAMQGHPNSWWGSAFEARHEGVKRELEESNAELLDALCDLYEQNTNAHYYEDGLNAIKTAEKVIAKAKGEME